MNDIEKIAFEMRLISSRLFRGAQLLVDTPSDYSLITGQIADKKLLSLLRMEFERLAKMMKRPVARYTIHGNRGSRDVGSIGEMLTGYRHLYGICRTAITTNQKIDTFDHHTPYSLSWGYVDDRSGLTFGMIESAVVQRELDFEESVDDLELVGETTRVINSMISSSNPDQLHRHIDSLGRGPMKALLKWANAHEDAGCGVDAEWVGVRESNKLHRNYKQVEALSDVLSMSEKDEKPEIYSVKGVFLGGYSDTRRFRFQGEDRIVYHGRVSKELNVKPKAYPAQYIAKISTIKGIRVATGEEFRTHTLIELEPIKKS